MQLPEEQLHQFEEKIGYPFQNLNLLYEALAHSSYANEKMHHVNSNERLEFLGDSVLSIVVSDYLFSHFPNAAEGLLTKTRASLVCENMLFEFAKQIDLGNFILLGKGEEHSGGRQRPSIVSDAFEAVIAAIYLDGGMEAASKHILRFIPKDLDLKHNANADYKTLLQEIIQKNPEEKIQYVLVGETGPDNDKEFVIEIHLNEMPIGTGVGKSKKKAEQMAAREALELMGYKY